MNRDQSFYDDSADINSKIEQANNLTKYPTLRTWSVDFFEELPDDVILTELVGGVQARLILYPTGEYLIGSDDAIIYAEGDKVVRDQNRIVETVKKAIPGITRRGVSPSSQVVVYYGVVYGGNIAGGENYTTNPDTAAFLVYDIALIDSSVMRVEHTQENAKAWNQTQLRKKMVDYGIQGQMCGYTGLKQVPRIVHENVRPTADVNNWLATASPKSQCGLSADCKGKCKGIVLRSNAATVCKIKPIEAVKEAVVAEPTPAPPVKKGPFGRPLKPKVETQEV